MPDEARRVYWDACVFLSYINGDEDRSDTILQLLDEAHEGKFELLTSMVSQVEVAYGRAEQEGGEVSPEVLDKIVDLWLPGAPTHLVEFHRLIAERGRDLVREERLERDERLTPLDAIHVATAMEMGVSEFHTYDGKLLSRNGRFGFPIVEPQSDTPKLEGWGKTAS